MFGINTAGVRFAIGFCPTFAGITSKTILLMNRRHFLRAGSLTGFTFSALGLESFFSPSKRRMTGREALGADEAS